MNREPTVPLAPTTGVAEEFPVYRRLGISIVSGEGSTVTDTEGRTYLDFYGGHAACSLGHRHPRLVAALAEQGERLLFQTNLVELSARDAAVTDLAAFLGAGPGSGLDRVFFVNSGAEAVENALRLAFRSTVPGRGGPRTNVVALTGGFHGRTAAAAVVSDGSERWYGFPHRPFEVRRVGPDDPEGLERAIDDTVAAVITEPVQGVAGARPVPEESLRAIRTACDHHGVRWISDEVQCGVGRTGEPCAATFAGVRPDIVTLAKGIAGGFPAGAVVATADVVSGLEAGDLGTTFGGGPLACAMISAVLRTILADDLCDRARVLEAQIRERCTVGPVVEIQGRGLLLGLRTAGPAREVLAALRTHGILAGGAADPRIVRLMPPLTLEDEAVDRLVTALEEVSL